MFDILRQKILRLGRDEDGAALVITLAMLMFLYASCAGVFAIGQTVKDRIHLQNACDAAAYSAAVVQADTLSRIATINRAMSWTYVSMTRRQMDQIVRRWLEHVVRHYTDDRDGAEKWYNEGTRCPLHSGWDISTIRLNGHDVVTVGMIKSVVDAFPSHVDGQKDSFYAADTSAMAEQIVRDKETIGLMNYALTTLAKDLPDREEDAAEEILRKNVPDVDLARCRWMINHSPDVIAGREYKDYSSGGYLRDLHSEKEEEDLFVSYSTGTGARESFEKGAGFKENPNHFFSYGNGTADTYGSVGLQRAYRRTNGHEGNKVYAEWTWWATKSACPPPEYDPHDPPGIPYETDCGHSCHSDCVCGRGNNTWDDSFKRKVELSSEKGCWVVQRSVRVHGDVKAIYDAETYVGERAKPLVLRPDYFGPAGTITVGLAKRNENPWFGVLKRVAEYAENGAVLFGIHGAFNPFVEWSWALSSAKAGYKFLEQKDAPGDYLKDDACAYRVSWSEDDQSWNLCQSDWDAVFVPVRSNWLGVATENDEGIRWGEEDTSALLDGEWEPLGVGSGSSEFAVHNVRGLPRMHNSGSVDGTLQLGRLKDLFFH